VRPGKLRKQVYVLARMRSGAVWSDILIKSMSGRGLSAEAANPPTPLTYVEIRRGTQTVVGRVIWVEDSRFGVGSQDDIDADAIVNEPRLATRPKASSAADAVHADRRRDPTREVARQLASGAERSRRLSAAMQFTVMVGLGATAAALLAVEVFHVLSVSMGAISERL
jgi:hypothetical protein